MRLGACGHAGERVRRLAGFAALAADLNSGGPLLAEYRSRQGRDTDITAHLETLRHEATGKVFCRVLELGTRSGMSTSAFLAALELNGGHLWSIDVNDPDVPAWWHENPLWSFLKAHDLSAEARVFGPPQVDVLFIDTSHEYGHTLDELRAYVPRVVPGGVVLMHDTEYDYENNREMQPADPHASHVGRALDDYCAETGLTWENKPGCFGLGVMRIP